MALLDSVFPFSSYGLLNTGPCFPFWMYRVNVWNWRWWMCIRPTIVVLSVLYTLFVAVHNFMWWGCVCVPVHIYRAIIMSTIFSHFPKGHVTHHSQSAALGHLWIMCRFPWSITCPLWCVHYSCCSNCHYSAESFLMCLFQTGQQYTII
jgi:type IV secretory pathway VirB3-like protein